MRPLSELPEILTRTNLGHLTGRNGRGFAQLAARGLAAAPALRHEGRPIWLADQAMTWFRNLHNHAVIVPAGKPELSDLQEHGVYVCPVTSRHISPARPRMLVAYVRGHGRVFDVEAVETVNQDVPGTRPAGELTRWLTQTRDADRYHPSPWTVFHLAEVGTVETVTPAVSSGRYVPLGDVQRSLETGTLVLTPLDTAFPAQQ